MDINNINNNEFNQENQSNFLRKRIISIDSLRGLVMILMLLDHTKNFFGNFGFSALDLTKSNTALFLTRWITHLCATSFILLAGIAIYLSLKQKKNKAKISRFLLLRGFWLIFLELTIISWALTFSPGFFFAQVIWVIGWCMIILAILIHLNTKVIAIFGLTLIIGHNLLDSISIEQFGNFGWFWAFLHQQAKFEPISGINFFLVYPLIPWVGVMASGYALGIIFTWEKQRRLLWLRNGGIILLFSFIVIRFLNIYGDSKSWTIQSNLIKTLLSFINCSKYPPSLLYLLITLSLAFLLLYFFEKYQFSIFKPLIVFGRVPLFFYIIHLWVIHFLAILSALPKYGFKAITIPSFIFPNKPSDYGFDLHHIYFIWLIIIMILYPVCHWFNNYKSTHKFWWLNYL